MIFFSVTEGSFFSVYPLEKAVERAKEYISGALEAGLDLGSGSGPLNHAFDLNSRFSD